MIRLSTAKHSSCQRSGQNDAKGSEWGEGLLRPVLSEVGFRAAGDPMNIYSPAMNSRETERQIENVQCVAACSRFKE
jgi:hypothetical protein